MAIADIALGVFAIIGFGCPCAVAAISLGGVALCTVGEEESKAYNLAAGGLALAIIALLLLALMIAILATNVNHILDEFKKVEKKADAEQAAFDAKMKADWERFDERNAKNLGNRRRRMASDINGTDTALGKKKKITPSQFSTFDHSVNPFLSKAAAKSFVIMERN